MPDKFYAQVLTPGVWLVLSNVAVRHRPSLQVLSNHGQDYDYRIADSQALLCAQDLTVEPSKRAPLEGLWTRLAPMRTARSEVAAAELNSKIYVLGGFGRGATANEEYDPVANKWRSRAPIPRGVDHAATVALEGLIYLIGGFDERFRPVDTVWAYDPSTDSWTTAQPLPTARHGLGAVAIGNRIYVLAEGPTPGGSQSALNEVFMVLADRP